MTAPSSVEHGAALGELGGRTWMGQLSRAEKMELSRKGGIARAEKLSAAERSRIATLAVKAREQKRAPEKGAFVERVYQYLLEYITAKKYPPSQREIALAMGWRCPQPRLKAALKALQQDGRIRLFPRIGLPPVLTEQMASFAFATTNIAPPSAVMIVENAIDWRRILKEFR